jgi:hypothetical protein
MPALRRRLRAIPRAPGVFLVAVLVVAWSAPVAGQGVTASLGGGLASPTGYLNTGAGMGFHGMAAVSLLPTGFPVGFRIEGMYSQFGFSDDAGHFRVLQGTVNAVYHLPVGRAATIRPYLIAGLGFYNYKSIFSDQVPVEDEANTDRGINGGGGFDFATGSVRLFAEARYHRVSTEGEDPEFVPSTVGIQFGGP